jgi:hypothetical protein
MTTTTLPRTCGCGETQDVTTVRMSDRLWTELFSVEGAERPEYAAACPVCISDWYRYAGPLQVVSAVQHGCAVCGYSFDALPWTNRATGETRLLCGLHRDAWNR